MLQRILPAGFIAPCLPSKTDKLPSRSEWLHEIKHDGFRVISKERQANEALQPPWQRSHLSLPADCRDVRPPRSHSCIIDGACDDNGITSFNRVRYRRHHESISLYAFDLIELNADDLRRDPLIGPEATLEIMLAKAGPGIRFNEHMEGDGETVFRLGGYKGGGSTGGGPSAGMGLEGGEPGGWKAA